MDLFDHMSDHTGVVHSRAPFLEHMHDHLSADHLSADHLSANAPMWSALMTLCPCLKKKAHIGVAHNQPHTGVALGVF